MRPALPGFLGAVPPTYQEVLGGILTGLWHQSSGLVKTGSVFNSWTDMIGGRVLTKIGSVTVGADGTNFQGKDVVLIPANNYVEASFVVNELVPLASRPYVFTVSRYGNTTNSGIYPYLFRTPSTECMVSFCGDVGLAGNKQNCQFKQPSNKYAFTSTDSDTVVHCDEMWLDGTNCYFRRDGAQTQTAATGVLTDALDYLQLGGTASTRHFLWGICDVVPTAAQRDAVLQRMRFDAM